MGAGLNAPIQANLSSFFRPTYSDSAPPIYSSAIARCSRFLLTLYALSTAGITSSRGIHRSASSPRRAADTAQGMARIIPALLRL
jgi:hypothetical protein